MCRIVAYLGPQMLISHVVTEPTHSIIHQSYHAKERSEPLNGDGFGIGWYVPEISHQPAIFKDVTPAWNNENLEEIARVTVSHCIFGHVRAASPHSAVHRLNSHPFSHGHLLFMHNGGLGGFPAYRRQILNSLSDEAFNAILGSTDSEHAFAVFLDHYARREALGALDRLSESMRATIHTLEAMRESAGVSEPSFYNFAVSDGVSIVSCRCASAKAEPSSLYVMTGHALRLESGHYEMNLDPPYNAALVASERLSAAETWQRVEPGSLVLIGPGTIDSRPL